MKPKADEKPPEAKVPQPASTEAELLLHILHELRKLNERAEKTGVAIRDIYR